MTNEVLEKPFLQEQSIQQKPTVAPEELVGKKLLLCVSENVSLAERQLVPVLQQAGFEVELIEANPAKLPDLHSKPYALILFDVSVPNGPGYQLCEMLRNDGRLPVMFILRRVARGDVLRAYQAGADAYVLFPFDEREFLARMGALLRRRPARRGLV